MGKKTIIESALLRERQEIHICWNRCWLPLIMARFECLCCAVLCGVMWRVVVGGRSMEVIGRMRCIWVAHNRAPQMKRIKARKRHLTWRNITCEYPLLYPQKHSLCPAHLCFSSDRIPCSNLHHGDRDRLICCCCCCCY